MFQACEENRETTVPDKDGVVNGDGEEQSTTMSAEGGTEDHMSEDGFKMPTREENLDNRNTGASDDEHYVRPNASMYDVHAEMPDADEDLDMYGSSDDEHYVRRSKGPKNAKWILEDVADIVWPHVHKRAKIDIERQLMKVKRILQSMPDKIAETVVSAIIADMTSTRPNQSNKNKQEFPKDTIDKNSDCYVEDLDDELDIKESQWSHMMTDDTEIIEMINSDDIPQRYAN